MSEASPHKGWHSRGYLPHLDAPGEIQAITFRLGDALPQKVIELWKEELRHGRASLGPRASRLALENQRSGASDDSKSEAGATRSQLGSQVERILRERIARYEDAGYGECLLRDPTCARVVQEALLHHDGRLYRLLEWCVMPNHVHVMIHTDAGIPLGEIVRRWKTYTARIIHRHLGRSGTLWSPDYHDRYLRDADHCATARRYIRQNPVKAALCHTPGQWPWSSAFGEVK